MLLQLWLMCVQKNTCTGQEQCTRYFVDLFLSSFISPKAPTTTGIVLVFKCHIFSISISGSLYLLIFSIIFTEMFLSLGMFISISVQTFYFLSLMIMSGWFSCIVCVDRKASEDGNICSLNYRIRMRFIPIWNCFYPIFQCRYWLPCHNRFCPGVSIEHPEIRWSILSLDWDHTIMENISLLVNRL